MHAHAEDLRSELHDLDAPARSRLVAAVSAAWRTAELSPPDQALCAFAERLTLTPARMRAEDLEALRSAGFSEPAIHDAIQVVSYFNYINRVADAAHVDLEPEMPPDPRSSGG